MKEAYYFSHDANARNDPDILAMRSKYGTEGYGMYWILIEMLREQSDYKMKLTQYTRNALAMQMQCEPHYAESFLQDCIDEFDLLESDGNHFWSNSLVRRMAQRDRRSEQARKAAMARWSRDDNSENNSEDDADAMREQCDSNAIKERKVNIKPIVEKVISRLNQKTDSKYKPTTQKTKEKIRARLSEGFSLEDFYTVIDKKTAEWSGTEMEKYLRPITLFGTKFESYLNQSGPGSNGEVKKRKRKEVYR